MQNDNPQVRREYKMPALYLLDSIIKNHGDPYRAVFQPHLVAAFAAVFEANEDPGVRTQLYKLRNTWPSLFDPRVLEALDVKVQREFDRKWPVQKVPQAAQPQPVAPSPNIHINPAHIKNASFERELEAKRAELKRLQLQKLQMEIDKAAEEIARKEVGLKDSQQNLVSYSNRLCSLRPSPPQRPRQRKEPRL